MRETIEVRDDLSSHRCRIPVSRFDLQAVTPYPDAVVKTTPADNPEVR